MSQMPQSNRERLNVLIAASKDYETRADQIQYQLDFVNQTIAALLLYEETIENLKNLQDGQEILLPLGNIAYLKAKIMDSSNALMYVGASVFVEKSLEAAKEQLNMRLEKLNKSQTDLMQAMQQTLQKIQQIRNEVERIATEMQQEPPPMGGS